MENNLNILGPYAKIFTTQNINSQQTQPNSTVSKSNRSQKQELTASLSKLKIKPIPTTSTVKFAATTFNNPVNTTRTQAPKKDTNWSSFYKKANSNFVYPIQAKLNGRMIQAEERRHNKRTELVTDNRNINVEELRNFQTPSVKKLASNKSRDMIPMESTDFSKSVVSVAPTLPPLVKATRKEQLLKWKREKDEINKIGPQKNPPFKTGPAVPILRMQKPAVNRNPKVAESKIHPAGERRMTRAMAKAQATPLLPTSTNVANINQNVSRQKPKPDVKMETNEKENVITVVTKSRPSKIKGMNFDSIYIEYNDVFLKACISLLGYSEKWSKFMKDSYEYIPEEICGDIESSLGQAKLLMDSKLPQFAELLYFYLSKHQDPQPILPGDLQGWWDVAVISIDKVKDRFDKLAVLKENNWIEKKLEKQIVRKVQPKSDPLIIAKPVDTISSSGSKRKSNAKANSGLMAFLAEKRKRAMEDKEKLTASPESVDEVYVS